MKRMSEILQILSVPVWYLTFQGGICSVAGADQERFPEAISLGILSA
jgi:hypothetical protein